MTFPSPCSAPRSLKIEGAVSSFHLESTPVNKRGEARLGAPAFRALPCGAPSACPRRGPAKGPRPAGLRQRVLGLDLQTAGAGPSTHRLFARRRFDPLTQRRGARPRSARTQGLWPGMVCCRARGLRVRRQSDQFRTHPLHQEHEFPRTAERSVSFRLRAVDGNAVLPPRASGE